jgi:hypothetical protein
MHNLSKEINCLCEKTFIYWLNGDITFVASKATTKNTLSRENIKWLVNKIGNFETLDVPTKTLRSHPSYK